MRLGFVGTGTISAAIVDGICAAWRDVAIIVSPRSAATAAALAARHANVRIAESNQQVLDASDMVILAVRPQIAGEVLPALRFRSDHHVVSLIATLTLDYLRSVTAPAGRITRAVPIPSVARRQGPTAFYPPDPDAKSLFDALGTAIPLDKEADFDVFTAATAVMASYFAFADTVSGWMESAGIASDPVRAYVGQMLQGLSTADPNASFAALADEHQTRGGLNEQVIRAVAPDGRFAELHRALDAVLARVRAGPGQP